ncbi:hypothetical protein F5876DRAFT_52663, partial [Lentinula aff. lateritia]
IGLAYSALLGLSAIFMGILICLHADIFTPGSYDSTSNVRYNLKPFTREGLLLVLNMVILKPAILSIGIAHETALKWTLAREEDRFKAGCIRLEFNSNFRFLAHSYSTWSATGLPATTYMATSLALTYASSSMVLLELEDSSSGYNTVISFISIIILGVSILSQSVIAGIAILMTDIPEPSWNQSPITTAHILASCGLLQRQKGRCMLGLAHQFSRTRPKKPAEVQISAWNSHQQFSQFVQYILMLVTSGFYWGLVIKGMIMSGVLGSQQGTSVLNFKWSGEAPVSGILWGLAILVGFQGGIVTTALTCTETLVSLDYDEKLWREATSKRGTDPSPSFLKKYIISWQPTAILLDDPFFHWLFGLAVGFSADTDFHVRPLPVRVFGLLIIFSATLGVDVPAFRKRPRPLCPKTYGHLQTLVDLVDEWSNTIGEEKLYWGHNTACND